MDIAKKKVERCDATMIELQAFLRALLPKLSASTRMSYSTMALEHKRLSEIQKEYSDCEGRFRYAPLGQFGKDLADQHHKIRQPVTGVDVSLEVMLRHKDDETYQRNMRRAIQFTERTLARIEACWDL